MIGRVKRFFTRDRAMRPKDRNRMQGRDIRVAVCALFVEMAYIDGEFSESEQEDIIRILKQHYHLSGEHVTELVAASKKELEESIDLWQFTNLVNQTYARDEKIRIIEMVWHVVYADERLDRHEDYLAHKLAKLLRLTHKELVDAKLKVRASRLEQPLRSYSGPRPSNTS